MENKDTAGQCMEKLKEWLTNEREAGRLPPQRKGPTIGRIDMKKVEKTSKKIYDNFREISENYKKGGSYLEKLESPFKDIFKEGFHAKDVITESNKSLVELKENVNLLKSKQEYDSAVNSYQGWQKRRGELN